MADARLPVHSGTILPGITRKSIIDLARQRGYEVQERAVAVEEVQDADELFCTARRCACASRASECPSDAAAVGRAQGTAVVVVPVGSVTYKGQKIVYQVRVSLCPV
jgi:branched-chain amino acid aminotransferase